MYIISYLHLTVKKIPSDTLALVGFSCGSIDPFYDIDPFDQKKEDFNITSVVNCASEEYVEKERVFLATDDDHNDNGEFLPGAIRSVDSAEGEENDEETEDN